MNDGFDDERDSSWVPSEDANRSLELNPQQRDIYQNLKNIGEEIAAFYFDGLKILQDGDFQTAASLLGHLAKEIDSGLKDLLPTKEDTQKIFNLLDGKGFAQPKQIALILAALNLDINDLQVPKPLTEQDRERIEKRLRSDGLDMSKELAPVLMTLNLDIDNLPSADAVRRFNIAIRWIDVSIRFNDFDHDHGVGKPPRPIETFIPLWETFEGVLANLVGNYLNFTYHVINPILDHKVPTKEIKNSFPNMIKPDPLEAGPGYPYFFGKIEHRGWLEFLNDAGYFNPKYNPPIQEVPDQPGYYTTPIWHALEYVMKVADRTINRRSNQIIRILIEIIDAITNYIDQDGERIENGRTDLQTIKIIATLPTDKIESQHIAFLGTALKSKLKFGLVDQEIGQTILPKFLDGGEQELTLALLRIILEVRSVDGRICPVMDEHWLEDALKKHGQAIANLCGVEAAQIILEQIRTLANADAHLFNFIQLVKSDLSQLSQVDYTELLVSFTSCLFQFTEPNSIKETVQVLLNEPHAIIRRIAVKAISQHYGNLKQLFWEWEGNPLDEYELKPEMYQLIQTNSSTFDNNEMERMLQWIESTQD